MRTKGIEVPKISRQEFFEVVKNATQERTSERSEAIEVPKISRQEFFEVVKNATHEPISERSEAIQVSKTLYQEKCRGSQHYLSGAGCQSAQDFVPGVPRSKISIRRVFLNRVKISCLESVEVDPDLLRTVKQYLDTGCECPSRFFERIRERILQQVEKEKNPLVFLTV